MTGWKRLLWTLGLAAVWAFLGAMAVLQWDIFSIGTTEIQAIVTAVITAVGMAATNYLAPWIPQYGIGSKTE